MIPGHASVDTAGITAIDGNGTRKGTADKRMTTNCNNCGAPFRSLAAACEYCGTITLPNKDNGDRQLYAAGVNMAAALSAQSVSLYENKGLPHSTTSFWQTVYLHAAAATLLFRR